MKKLFFTALCFTLFSVAGFAQTDAISKHFEQYMDDESFTTVFVSQKMFGLVGGLEIDELDPELRDMISKMKGLRILQKDADGRALFKEANKKVRKSGFEELMTVRGEDENVNIHIRDRGDIIEELVLVVGGAETFVMISLEGEMSLKQLSKLANKMDFEGLEHLKNLDQLD